MRTIRFRLWDKKNESFVREPYYAISLLGTLQINGHSTVEPNRYVIQQFTGLFDRLKVGVYEGDIVRLEGTAIGVVEYSGACFIARSNGLRLSLNDMAPEYVEVIGNIYETPDLLK